MLPAAVACRDPEKKSLFYSEGPLCVIVKIANLFVQNNQKGGGAIDTQRALCYNIGTR